MCAAFDNMAKERLFVRPSFDHIIVVVVKQWGFLDKGSNKVWLELRSIRQTRQIICQNWGHVRTGHRGHSSCGPPFGKFPTMWVSCCDDKDWTQSPSFPNMNTQGVEAPHRKSSEAWGNKPKILGHWFWEMLVEFSRQAKGQKASIVQ